MKPSCPDCGSHLIALQMPATWMYQEQNSVGTHPAGWFFQGAPSVNTDTALMYPDAIGHCTQCGQMHTSQEFFNA